MKSTGYKIDRMNHKVKGQRALSEIVSYGLGEFCLYCFLDMITFLVNKFVKKDSFFEKLHFLLQSIQK